MSYGQTYGNFERSIAQAIIDELIARGLIIENSFGNATWQGSEQANSSTSYIVQQLELSRNWHIFSPIVYSDFKIYAIQIGLSVLSQPTVVSADVTHINPQELSIQFNEPCKGFVTLR